MRPSTATRAVLLPRLVLPGDLRAAGLDADVARRAVAEGLWSQVLPRAYLSDAGPVERSDRQLAALDRADGRALLTGVDACLYWGLRDVPADPRVHLLVESARRLVLGPDVRVTRTARLPHRVHNRLPLVPPPRAVVAACLGRDLQSVRALITAAVWDQHVDLDSLRTTLAAGPRRGSGACRIALADVAGGAASAPEAEAAAALRGRTPVPFLLNAELHLNGVLLGVADGWLVGLGIGWELDSVRHHGDREALDATLARHQDFADAGVELVHLSPSRFRADPDAFVVDLLRRAGARLAAGQGEPPGLSVALRRPGPALPPSVSPAVWTLLADAVPVVEPATGTSG